MLIRIDTWSIPEHKIKFDRKNNSIQLEGIGGQKVTFTNMRGLIKIQYEPCTLCNVLKCYSVF